MQIKGCFLVQLMNRFKMIQEWDPLQKNLREAKREGEPNFFFKIEVQLIYNVCSFLLYNKVIQLYVCIYFFFLLCFFGPHLQQREVPRLGVKLELQLPTYTTAPGNAGSLTH